MRVSILTLSGSHLIPNIQSVLAFFWPDSTVTASTHRAMQPYVQFRQRATRVLMALFCLYIVYLGIEQIQTGKKLFGQLVLGVGLVWALLLLITTRIQTIPDRIFNISFSLICLPMGFYAAYQNGLLPMSIMLCMPVIFYTINPIRLAGLFTVALLLTLITGISVHDAATLSSPMGVRLIGSTIAISLGTHLSYCYFNALHRRLGEMLLAKDEFLRTLNHELRTPLHSLLSLTHLLKANASDAPDLQENIRSLDNLGQQMSELTNGVLSLAETENKPEVNSKTISPALSMRKLSSMYAPMAAEHGSRIESYVHPRVPELIEIDPIKLKQILGNFITNSIKYSKSADIQLFVKPQSFDTQGQVETLRFGVSDCGQGMSKEALKDLFIPFTRQSAAYASNSSGLGLSISKSLAELLGGQVGVQSTLGRGTTIWADLPCGKTQNAELIVENPQSKPWDLTGTRLLVIEDDAMLLKLNCAILERNGARCTPAADGQTALQALENSSAFHLILVDYQLPDFRGDMLIRKIKELPAHQNTPVLLLSGGVMKHDIDLLEACGVKEILAKPIAPKHLVGKIIHHINFSELELSSEPSSARSASTAS